MILYYKKDIINLHIKKNKNRRKKFNHYNQ